MNVKNSSCKSKLSSKMSSTWHVEAAMNNADTKPNNKFIVRT